MTIASWSIPMERPSGAISFAISTVWPPQVQSQQLHLAWGQHATQLPGALLSLVPIFDFQVTVFYLHDLLASLDAKDEVLERCNAVICRRGCSTVGVPNQSGRRYRQQ